MRSLPFVNIYSPNIRRYSSLFVNFCHLSPLSDPSLFVTILDSSSLFVTIRHHSPLFVTIRKYSPLFATIRHYSPLFVTIRHYSYYSLFAIRDNSLFAIRVFQTPNYQQFWKVLLCGCFHLNIHTLGFHPQNQKN